MYVGTVVFFKLNYAVLLKHQEQLEELKQLLSACDAAEEKIRYAESEEGKNQATAVLLPLLEVSFYRVFLARFYLEV